MEPATTSDKQLGCFVERCHLNTRHYKTIIDYHYLSLCGDPSSYKCSQAAFINPGLTALVFVPSSRQMNNSTGASN